MNKVILIDDMHAGGWADVFRLMFEQIYGNLITFEALEIISNEVIDACYEHNWDALFIQDNQLANDANRDLLPGLYWLGKWGTKRTIIMHSADDIAWEAAKKGAYFYMRKDDPERPKTNAEMKEMIIDFHKHVIQHFKLRPELMWLVYLQLGYTPEDKTDSSPQSNEL